VYRRVADYSNLFLSRSGFGEADVVIVDSHGVRDGEPEMGAHDMIHSVLVFGRPIRLGIAHNGRAARNGKSVE